MRKWTFIVAVSLTLTGSGTVGDITQESWSVNEECTPAAIGDLSGGTGSVGLTAAQGNDSEFVVDNFSTFTDTTLGSISGKVATAQSQGATEDTDTTVGLSLTTPLTALAVERTAAPSPAGSEEILSQKSFLGPSTPVTLYDSTRLVQANGYTYLGRGGTGSIGVIQKYDSDWVLVSQLVSPAYPATGAFTGTSPFTVDPSGNQYIRGWDGYTILKYDSSNVYVTQWGTSGTGNGQFNAVEGLDHDSSGNIYAIDKFLHRVQRFTPDGTYVSQWGSQGAGTAQFQYPSDITITNDDRVYISDAGINDTGIPYIREFTIAGTFVNRWGWGGSAVAATSRQDTFFYGYGYDFFGYRINSDDLGNVWAVNRSTPSLRKYGPDGLLVTVAPIERPSTLVNSFESGDVSNSATGNGSVVLRADYSSATLAAGTSYINEYLGSKPDLKSLCRFYIQTVTGVGISMDYLADSNPRTYTLGWTANVWDQLKALGAAYAIEFTCINNVITVNNIGSRTLALDNVRGGSASLALDVRATGRSIEVKYQQPTSGSGTLYSATTDNRILTLAVGQDTTEIIQTGDNYAVSVNPVIQTDSTSVQPGQYYVIGSDNLPVTTAQWTAYGASVTVAVGSAPGTIEVLLVGPTSAIPGVPAPYSLAISGGSTTRPAFSVTGTGVFTDPQTLTLLTGADPTKTPVEVAQTINNIFVDTLARAYDRGVWASVIAAGPLLTLSATVPTSTTSGFGLTVGSLVSFKESTYRVTTATIGNVWTQITATRHTTVGARDTFATGRTVGQHDTLWSGYEVMDEFIKPYRA